MRLGRISEMHNKADTLKADDAAWKQTITVLMEAGTKQKDYSYIIRKSQNLIERSPDSEIRLQALLTLAKIYWKAGETEKAKASYEAVVKHYPKTPYAEEAKGNLMEIDLLNPGQSAPPFAAKELDGSPIALGDFKGKVVLLKFWASW
jgi:outer membrane protein assembly factor BamD (BamD/ComL family)